MHLLGPRVRLLLLTLTAALSACATWPFVTGTGTPTSAALPAAGAASGPPAGVAAARPAAAASAASAPAAPAPPAPPPFATVIKDAKKVEGLFTLWQKDEKLWIELLPEDYGKPLFLSPKLASGIGEPAVVGGLMHYGIGGGAGGPQLVEFRRLHNQIQLVARNTHYIATAGTPEARAVQAAYSSSLLGSGPVASLPHPTTKAVLLDVTSIFVSDMLGVGSQLQRAYRQGYGLDARNSMITGVRAKPDLLVIEVQNHYSTSSLSVPQPGGSAGPAPTMPRTVPDARSLFVNLHYSISRLPAQAMRGRLADPRVGYFDTVVQDFGNDLARTSKVRYVNRWRLEKKDPAAVSSEPVKPITYWLDRTIPEKYRPAITEGILEWNKAFERIGFKNAIVVQVQSDNADFDTLDADRASVRWMTNASARFGAIGPSHVDPRSGEILDADIGVESLSSRSVRALRSQILTSRIATDWPNLPDAKLGNDVHDSHAGHDPTGCHYAAQAAEQLGYALEVFEARGDIDPESPEAQQFVFDYLKDTTIHEVGHTLGLRHNFRSSRAYTEAQVSDLEFTRANGISASVMDYRPVNLPLPGARGGTAFQLALGPYDYWAIEYAYTPLAEAHEKSELMKIAARSGVDRTLVYGTDEDNYLGVDPESLHFDLGEDVLAFARKRFDIARDLLQRQENRDLKGTEDYAVLRRSIAYALRDAGRAGGIVARQIGGIRTLRDYPGGDRDPLQPVSAELQRKALDLITRGLLASDSLVVSPALQRRLAPDYLERSDALGSGDGAVLTDFSVAQFALDAQRAVLNQLMSDAVAVRILDSEAKADRPAQAFRLSELYRRLSQEIWSELGKSDIPVLRRELQREHVNRMANQLLRPSAASRADARSLSRIEARALLARMNVALKRSVLSPEARAHLEDSAETLSLALTAKLQRFGT